MIPTRLRFSGIRDYHAVEMNLGDAGEHILITGPNGAGKSTLSFCMGAVLRSSKVDIEGLKSQNLREDETWRATIHFLFKNEGPSRIDAPLYIEFRLNCEQLPKQPIKLQYEIYDGDELEQLTLKQAYRSGDAKQNNFGAYRRELQIKYKVHPDLFYLIWYQQEVNQFSVMSPEERFRVFSEMHQIDRAQREWETSLEVVKEARATFNEATIMQKREEHELDIARHLKERFENNKKRLEENGYLYALTTHQLKEQTEKERQMMDRLIEEHHIDLEELGDEERDVLEASKGAKEKNQTFKEAQIDCEKKNTQTEEKLARQEARFADLTKEMESLEATLSDLQEAYGKLPFSEKETKKRFADAKEAVHRLTEKELGIKEKIMRSEKEIEENQYDYAKKQAEIEQWKRQAREAEKLLGKYSSSHKLETELAELEEALQKNRLQRDALEIDCKNIEEELTMLARNQIVSPRQEEAIRQLRQQQIKAYPLRQFVKLVDDAPIEKERLLDAIKYTIFYEGTTCTPFNDLYHVSLKKIVPTRSITSLPEYGLTMRTDLLPGEENHAARVLWWIEQFFLKEQPYLEKSVLIDARGNRGPQEKETYILSKKALANRQVQLTNQLEEMTEQLAMLSNEIEEQNERYRLWNADMHKVEEAEALLSKKVEQQDRLQQVEKIKVHLFLLQKTKEEFEAENQAIWKQVYEENQEITARIADIKVYEQFGQQAEKIEHLQQLKEQHHTMKQDISHLKRLVNDFQDQLDELHQAIREQQRQIDNLEDDQKRIGGQKEHHLAQIEGKKEAHIAMTQVKKGYEEELKMLDALIPELVEKAVSEEGNQIASQYDLQYRQSKAKIEFDNARNEKNIDPNAVENYTILEAEVRRKKDDLHALKNLLEENELRAADNENRLEIAISMQVQKINLLFGEYMGQFQFEGQIKYEKTMDKHGRPIFKLFIHVRKEGHRGKLVDVSLKARGGRVGKGVSGGEESLSSLLFALSLLQNLDNQAGFIVLDEFDSALDDTRKAKVFQLYEEKLSRKLIILSPKAHENDYYDKFQKAFIISHDPVELTSIVRGLAIK